MLDPQEIRKEWQEGIKKVEIKKMEARKEEAKKIFQWILKSFREGFKKGNFGNTISVWQYDDSNELNGGHDKYNMCYDREVIYPIICEVINSEEGYQASYRKDATYYDENAWELTVEIE